MTPHLKNMNTLQKINYKSFMASICGYLMIILLLTVFILFPNHPYSMYGRFVKTPPINNFSYQPLPHEAITITMNQKEEIFIEDEYVFMDQFLRKLECVMEEGRESSRKFLLVISENIPFGKIIPLLKILKELEINSVGLLEKGEIISALHFLVDMREYDKLMKR